MNPTQVPGRGAKPSNPRTSNALVSPAVEVYPAAPSATTRRPWIMWCHHHEPAPCAGNSWRGILAECPTQADAEQLALAHALTHEPMLPVHVETDQ